MEDDTKANSDCKEEEQQQQHRDIKHEDKEEDTAKTLGDSDKEEEWKIEDKQEGRNSTANSKDTQYQRQHRGYAWKLYTEAAIFLRSPKSYYYWC